jgi:hypothetical protein
VEVADVATMKSSSSSSSSGVGNVRGSTIFFLQFLESNLGGAAPLSHAAARVPTPIIVEAPARAAAAAVHELLFVDDDDDDFPVFSLACCCQLETKAAGWKFRREDIFRVAIFAGET